MRSGRWLVLCSAILASVAAAQQQPPPVFRGGTTVVEVDAIPKDRSGRFVADLRPDEFEVLEDGVPQTVETFYLVQGTAVTVPPATGTPSAPAPQAAPPDTRRVFILFFDLEHIAPGGVDRAKKAADQFLASQFRPGDVGGVVAGGTMVNGRLTSSREELQAAVKGVVPTDSSISLSRELRTWPRYLHLTEAWRVTRNERAPDGTGSLLDFVVSRACRERQDECSTPGSSTQVESELRNKATILVGQARFAAQQTVRAMSALASGLARLPGRKTVVLLTDGFFTEESWADLRQVVALAARAQARVYSLDTRGLNRGSASSDILSSEAPGRGTLAPPDPGDTNADAPNSLAVDTGGLAIRNENDFLKALEEVEADTSHYYVLGYRPANPTPDGRFRQIAVRVKRSGVSVRARKGYLPGANAAAPPGATSASPSSPSGGAAAVGTPTPVAPAATSRPPVGAVARVVPETAGPARGVRIRPDVGEQVSKLDAAARPRGGLSGDLLRQARMGWEAYQRGDVAAAQAALAPVAERAEAPAWVRYVLGWSHSALGRHVEAGEQWELVRQDLPAFEPVYFDLAESYLQQREFGRAVATLREAGKRWPEDVEIYNALGVIQAGRGALNDAIDTFEKAVVVAPDDETACYNLAKTLELRYVQGQRERRTSSMVSSGTVLTDRERAIEYYRRTVQLRGSLVERAEEGLGRLIGKDSGLNHLEIGRTAGHKAATSGRWWLAGPVIH